MNERGEWEPLKACCIAVLILSVCAIFGSQIPEIYVEAGNAGLGARGLPIAATGLAAGLALILLAVNLPMALRVVKEKRPSLEWMPLLRIGALVLLSFAYVWAITLFQYAIPTVLAMSALLALFGSRGVTRLVIVPAVAVIAYYFAFFILLGLFEPPGKLLSYDSYSFSLQIRRFLGL